MRKSTPARPSARSSEGSYCPDRGDFIWIDFNPQKGREQAGRRPALVLSPRRYNKAAGLCLVCPITGQAKGYPFEVALVDAGPITGVVLADQLKSVSWDERSARLAGKAPARVLAEVKARLAALLEFA